MEGGSHVVKDVRGIAMPWARIRREVGAIHISEYDEHVIW
jgi:hypothetical protein